MRRNELWSLAAGLFVCALAGCPGAKQHGVLGGSDGGGSQVSAGSSASGGSGAGAAGTAAAGHGGGAAAGTGATVHDAGSPAADGGAATPSDGGAYGGGCVRGGCSNELCSEASADPLVSDCLFRPEYACYQKASCARQASGSCGFTQTQALTDCLAQAKGDAGGAATGLLWYETCGAPVCKATPVDDPSVANCTTEKAGAACTTSGVKCDLVNGCSSMLLCTSTDPKAHSCPRSRARYKQDIAYLSTEQRQRVYRDLLTIPLASYEYKDDPKATPQLGFILEDVEPSPATRGDHVNLYGYLSMAVAAVQVQAQEIEALKREVEALRMHTHGAATSCEP